jgi:hypothetical protein
MFIFLALLGGGWRSSRFAGGRLLNGVFLLRFGLGGCGGRGRGGSVLSLGGGHQERHCDNCQQSRGKERFHIRFSFNKWLAFFDCFVGRSQLYFAAACDVAPSRAWAIFDSFVWGSPHKNVNERIIMCSEEKSGLKRNGAGWWRRE